eukprot:3326222-Rhodomonas_salina.1
MCACVFVGLGQYLEIINKISEVQVEVEAAEKLQVEAQRDLESESRKMRVRLLLSPPNHAFAIASALPATMMLLRLGSAAEHCACSDARLRCGAGCV